ncbi:MAG: helix-turn-helix domain-containing protein [Oscillospiraceae bacterium]|nr:helix-turn-helix domain-containing protein [Oscillospiraceae bacterium]
MTFGEKLQKLRARAGMSQDALAERLNVSRQAVSRWERDETMPETDKIVPLADLFGVTTDYLLREQPRGSAKEEKAAEQDWTDKLSHLAKTKGYLLGWLLIVWGGIDLLGLLATTMMVGGFFNIMSLPITATINGLPFTGPAGMMTQILWLPALYGIAKIALGVFVLRRGKEYAEKVKEEEER